MAGTTSTPAPRGLDGVVAAQTRMSHVDGKNGVLVIGGYELKELAGKVTAAYRSKGYILAQTIVPAQKVTDGTLTLKIVQGYIDQVKIQGDAGGARKYLEAYGARIKAVRPLTAPVLERELLLVSDLAGFQVRSVLTPSATAEGGRLREKTETSSGRITLSPLANPDRSRAEIVLFRVGSSVAVVEMARCRLGSKVSPSTANGSTPWR